MLFASQLLAAETGGFSAMSLLLPVALIAVFYFLLIRPQRKRQKDMAAMQQQIGVGQEVMTGAGLIGTVKNFEGEYVVLELSPGVNAKFVRQAIMRVVEPAADPSGATIESSETVAGSESDDSASVSETVPLTHDDGRKRPKPVRRDTKADDQPS